MIRLEEFGYEIALTIIYLSNFLAILNLLFKKREIQKLQLLGF